MGESESTRNVTYLHRSDYVNFHSAECSDIRQDGQSLIVSFAIAFRKVGVWEISDRAGVLVEFGNFEDLGFSHEC